MFASSVKTYVGGIGDVTAADRETLREKWESSATSDAGAGADFFGEGWATSDNGNDMDTLDALGNPVGAKLYSMNDSQPPKVDRYGEPIGVTPRLIKVILENSQPIPLLTFHRSCRISWSSWINA